ncbi:MAG: hypothetical protein KF767_07070 [Bdellovibrionaceae bacterium]|nr:hypothetical protein [Pseudobdellovibrionaceae bacterium]
MKSWKIWIQAVLLVTLVSTGAGAQSVSLPSQYVQQGQHNSHLLFGLNAQVLGSYCNLEWAPGEARCYLDFRDEDGERRNIFVRYEHLEQSHARILSRLKELSTRWKRKYPLDFWGRTVFFMYRAADHKALDELITGLEAEGLSQRVLMPVSGNERKIPYFYSDELVRGVFHIFIEAFSRYDLREGLWGPSEMAVYGDAAAEL